MVKVRQVEKRDLPRYKELTDYEKWNHGLSKFNLLAINFVSTTVDYRNSVHPNKGNKSRKSLV